MFVPTTAGSVSDFMDLEEKTRTCWWTRTWTSEDVELASLVKSYI